MFKYSWVTPETEAEYQTVLRTYAAKYRAWAVRTVRDDADFTTRFRRWWLSRGPTGFKSTEDSFRFKRELAAHIQAVP